MLAGVWARWTVALPLRGTTSGVVVESLATSSAAVLPPLVVGLKRTTPVQDSPGPSTNPAAQVPDRVNCPGFAPVTETLARATSPWPSLVKVAVWALLV